MSKHLKNIVISRLKDTVATFVTLPPDASPHTKGVRYFRSCIGIEGLWGAMNTQKEGAQRRKHIIVRPSRFRPGLFELYTYHFPKHWSAACVANRELIKLAQRQAHALERDHSMETLEWRVRFLMHYFRVFKGHQQPEPGLKPYSRFYQYTYVSIYRALQSARDAQTIPSTHTKNTPTTHTQNTLTTQATHYAQNTQNTQQNQEPSHPIPTDITFDPIPIRRLQSFVRRRQAFNRVFLGAMTPLIE